MKTEEQHAKDIVAKHALKDIVRKCLDNLSYTQLEFEIDETRHVISLKDFKGTTGRLIIIQAILAVKISDFYREQRMSHDRWSLECADPEDSEQEVDLEEKGMNYAEAREGYDDR